GVFQLEGSGMRSFLMSMQPHSFEDIIAAISLYRPGPMDFIPRYLKGRQNPQKIDYSCDDLEPILSVTYGCIVYQEQVMQIVRRLAGYSLGRADLMRRAMAKKKHDVMEKERLNFLYGIEEENIPGAISHGIKKEVAEHIFDEMAGFASYAFNKSHAAAYGVISVQTGYLKCHYPAQYLAAVMSSFLNNSGKIASYIQYCRKNGIEVLPPHVNESQGTFTVEKKDGIECIRFGLSAIKGLGEKAVQSIIEERNAGGPYRSIYDFCRRQKSEQITKRAVEGLVKAGCFKDLGANRNQQILVYEQAMAWQSQRRRNNIKGQMSMFDMAMDTDIAPKEEYPDVDECPYEVLLQMEKEMTGVYISGHPLENYAELLDTLDFSTQALEEINDRGEEALNFDGKNVTIGGLVSAIRTQTTKKGQLMSFLTLEDLYGQVECILFPRIHDRFYSLLNKDEAVLVNGKLSIQEDEDSKILVDSISPLKDSISSNNNLKQETPKGLNDVQLAKASKEKLFLKTKRPDMQNIMDRLKANSGDVPVYINLEDEKITLLTPREYWCSSGEKARETLLEILPDENIKVVINNE
ncbi:MAG: DNA polymerase III subunit alpha, partial [Eubacteriales bacterium]|nr:DNA polymerase III subunit alpha [Eubacteriales bacterium]